MENALRDTRPRSFILDKGPTASSDPDAIRAGGFKQSGDLHIESGYSFINQWNTEYISQALPFVMPRAVSGPDYPRQAKRYRRPMANFAAVVTPTEFLIQQKSGKTNSHELDSSTDCT